MTSPCYLCGAPLLDPLEGRVMIHYTDETRIRQVGTVAVHQECLFTWRERRSQRALAHLDQATSEFRARTGTSEAELMDIFDVRSPLNEVESSGATEGDG